MAKRPEIPKEAIPALYQAARDIYEKRLTTKEAILHIPVEESSARDYFSNYKRLLNGKPYKRYINEYALEYFLQNILAESGRDGLEAALRAVEGHIQYYEGLGRGRLLGILALHKKYSDILNDNTLPERLSDLRPLQWARVMDLANNAGVDVSAWEKFNGSKGKAATNPKFCYEWAFVQPNKLVVLNLWYNQMEHRDGKIVQDLNFRIDVSKKTNKPQWKARAQRVEQAVLTALQNNLPIKVIVCDGKRREAGNPDAESSKVEFRKLDPVLWGVTAYNQKTGECELTRGATNTHYVDQFILDQEKKGQPEKRAISGYAHVRNPKTRAYALNRAKGKCEWCGELGFIMEGGRIYLETHHVIPLSEDGADSIENIIALCPNDHRKAHYAADNAELREAMLKQLVSSD